MWGGVYDLLYEADLALFQAKRAQPLDEIFFYKDQITSAIKGSILHPFGPGRSPRLTPLPESSSRNEITMTVRQTRLNKQWLQKEKK